MRTRSAAALSVVALAPHVVAAQPALSSLWPNADGTRWDYRIAIDNWTGDASLRFDGTVETAGGTAQVLVASHPLPPDAARSGDSGGLLGAIWRARPDLRPALAAKYGEQLARGPSWFPLLLHGGYFMTTASSIQMWQPKWNHPTWTYATAELVVGATFTHQLVPELADDVFLHGTVESIDAAVQTPAGAFEPAVRIGYRIDYGWSEGVDAQQIPLGRFRSETRGRVHYAPDVGPVEMHEEFILYAEVDCGANPCPPEWTDLLGVSVQTIDMSLTGATVAVAPRTWGQVKALYQ